MTNSVIYTKIKFNQQKILDEFPQDILNSEDFLVKKQLAITHSDKGGWFDGVGSLYDYTENKFINETNEFTQLNSWFKGRYMEEVIREVTYMAEKDCVKLGRIRLMRLDPCTCYTLHQDPDEFRYHIPLKTNINCFFVSEGLIEKMYSVGSLYKFATTKHHTAVNASRETRLHIVFDTWK